MHNLLVIYYRLSTGALKIYIDLNSIDTKSTFQNTTQNFPSISLD